MMPWRTEPALCDDVDGIAMACGDSSVRAGACGFTMSVVVGNAPACVGSSAARPVGCLAATATDADDAGRPIRRILLMLRLAVTYSAAEFI